MPARLQTFLPILTVFLVPLPMEASSLQIISSEFIFETAPFPQCHASTVLATSQGELLAAWFGGTHEKHQDVGIWLSRREKDAWSAPVEVATGATTPSIRYPCWNPVLFEPKGGPVMLFYKVGPAPDQWWGMLRRSTDGGRSWSEAERLPEGLLGPIKNKPVQLESGEILSPSSSEHAGWRVHFERSSDGGKTWTQTPEVNDGHEFSAIQPSILVHRDGRLQAVGRTRQGRIFQIWSSDQGRTWGQMTSLSLPNPNAGTDAITLKDGRHLLVYNHTEKGRSPLNVAVSEDGVNWRAVLTLEQQPGEYSYPAVIQAEDGRIHITYTWQRKRIRHVVVSSQ